MKVKLIEVKNIPPVKEFSADNLSNVVVLAGPNGVGKTRLVQGLLQAFQAISNQPNIRLIIEATATSERDSWGKESLDTGSSDDGRKLTVTLQQNRHRSRWESSVIQFESDRTIQQIQPYNFSWDMSDPWEEELGWTYSFGFLRDRFLVFCGTGNIDTRACECREEAN